MTTMLPIVVFVGPSLRPADMVGLAADYRPAAGMGDVRLLLEGRELPRAVCILDGDYMRPALPPKEVVAALNAGVAIYGASGEGALRAVESESFGAIGVGKIFAAYASGSNDQADEVRCPIRSPDWTTDGHHLASWRLALEQAVGAEEMASEDAERFIAAAKAIDWRMRTLREACSVASATLSHSALAAIESHLRHESSNVMRTDARDVLAILSGLAASTGTDNEVAKGSLAP